MTEAFQTLISKLAGALQSGVHQALPNTVWERALLDVRYDRGGGSWSSKIRVHQSDGNVASVRMSNAIDLVLLELGKDRKSLGEEWFGLLLTVSASGECKLKLNYDSACADEPSFFEF